MKTDLQRSPIYQQLNDRLRSSLATDYERGDRFLTEREISEAFGVSRATANKALASLVSEGALEFRRGVGTFVRRDTIDYDVRSLVSFTQKARIAGKKPSTRLIRFEKVPALRVDPIIRNALRADEDQTLWELQRLRLADNVPVILEHRYVAHWLCPKLTKTQAKHSLYLAWTSTHQLQIEGADELIRAVPLAKQEASLLDVTWRSPALEVVSVGFVQNETPLWWERTLYRGDQYEFRSRLGPIQSATPARGALR